LMDGETQIHLEPKTLSLLCFLADEHPGEELTEDQIYNALWRDGKDDGGNVQQHISRLRELLGDPKQASKYIAWLPDLGGYKFIARVRSEGDLGRIDGLQRWSNARFFDLIAQVTHNAEDSEDLRLVTTAFLSIHEMGFQHLLRRGVRIRIVLTNPENWPLLVARNAFRTDGIKPEEAQHLGRRDLDFLARLKRRFPNGEFDWRVSDAMPCAIVAHSRNWAVFGLFPAHDSYLAGPMIDVEGGTELWRMLYDDWKTRWENPAKQAGQDVEETLDAGFA
jgi:DNA-binding winged helix-turn-helix (wHTH) protein